MPTYEVRVDPIAKEKMATHVRFLSQVSVVAARQLKNSYYKALKSLEKNPQRCPSYLMQKKNDKKLRFLLFSKRYRIVFEIAEKLVFVYDIQDCRQDTDKSVL